MNSVIQSLTPESLAKYFDHTDKDFQDMGYKFVSQPFTGCFLALQRLADYFEYYRKNGEVEKFLDSVFPYEEYEKLLGIEDELNIMDTIS